MRFYTASKLGSKRTKTPEGYLACLDVPIARTGEMIYTGSEIPELEAGRDGLIRVLREASDVFDPKSLASFVGKPVTNDHPPDMLNSSSYQPYVKGCGQNIRQGQGDQADLVLADLMFWDPVLIAAIEGGKDEVSNGYNAEYEFVSPGVYRQVGITGNHIAVVDEGRCGPRCAIGDSVAPNTAVEASAAGIALRASSGKVLFLRRGGNSDHPGTWCFPGGSVEPGEALTAAARRELSEETGLSAGDLHPLDARDGFVTFMANAAEEGTPRLNAEHTAFTWALPDDFPQPLHPGVAATLSAKRDDLDALPGTVAAMDTKSAPSCGCGAPHHHTDAKPARSRKRTRDMATAAPKKIKGSMLDRLRRTFQAKDEAGFEEAMTAVEQAAEQTGEEQDKAELADMIGQAVAASLAPAVAEALAPLTSRLDDVDAYITDRKTKDADEEKKRADEVKATADKAVKDNDAVAAFLKAKGLSAEDIAEVVAMVKKDEPTADSLEEGAGGGVDNGASEAGAAVEPAYNAGAGSTVDGKGTKDSVSLVAEFRDTVAKAEILAPGVKIPAFDAKAQPKLTTDSICALRRRALKSAFDSAQRKVHVAPFVDVEPDFSKMTCDAVKMAFGGAAELAKRANNPILHVGDAAQARNASAEARSTIAGMNKAAKDLWGNAR